MIRKIAYLLSLILFLTACKSNSNQTEEDDFPDFTQEELQQMIANNPEAQMQLQQQQNNADAILKKMEESLEQDPENLDNNYNLAKLYYQKYTRDSVDEYCSKAIKYYTKVIDLQTDYQKGHAYYNRMLCYVDRNQLDKALKDINTFIEVNKGQTPVNYLSMRAEIYYQKGEKEQACQDFMAALKVAQKDSLPVENKALWQERCAN